MSGSDGPAQQLAGLFAGGMPSLKKTGASSGGFWVISYHVGWSTGS